MDVIKNLLNQGPNKQKEAELPEQTEEPPFTRIQSIDDVPSIPKDCIIDVYSAEEVISALGTVGELVEGNHGGLIFELRDKEKAKGLKIPPKFTLEWYCLNFPFGAFLPNIVDVSPENPVGLEWDNDSFAHYQPHYDPNRWTAGVTLVGHLDGAAYAEYMKWVVNYEKIAPGYQAYAVWDRAQFIPCTTKQWIESNTCSTFVQASLAEMYRLGAKSETPKQILMRSYVPLVAKKKPKKANLTNPDEAKGVRDFYLDLNKAARGAGDKDMTTADFMRLLADRLEFFYIYETLTGVYTKVELSPPYFSLGCCRQPMSLPWQKYDIEGDGEMRDPGAFAEEGEEEEEEDGQHFATELAAGASGVGALLKKRIPVVLKNKYSDKLFIVLPTALVILGNIGVGIAVGAEKMGFDVKEFVAGLTLGLFIGVTGSKFL